MGVSGSPPPAPPLGAGWMEYTCTEVTVFREALKAARARAGREGREGATQGGPACERPRDGSCAARPHALAASQRPRRQLTLQLVRADDLHDVLADDAVAGGLAAGRELRRRRGPRLAADEVVDEQGAGGRRSGVLRE